MECPLKYQSVITQGNLVLKYFSNAMNGSCCWYALKQDQASFEVLTSSDKQEIVAVYQDGQLVYINKSLLRIPYVMKNDGSG